VPTGAYQQVPPGHARNWRKHCREYNACGERVYFVQNDWYRITRNNIVAAGMTAETIGTASRTTATTTVAVRGVVARALTLIPDWPP
jgi:hypothetical protein